MSSEQSHSSNNHEVSANGSDIDSLFDEVEDHDCDPISLPRETKAQNSGVQDVSKLAPFDSVLAIDFDDPAMWAEFTDGDSHAAVSTGQTENIDASAAVTEDISTIAHHQFNTAMPYVVSDSNQQQNIPAPIGTKYNDQNFRIAMEGYETISTVIPEGSACTDISTQPYPSYQQQAVKYPGHYGAPTTRYGNQGMLPTVPRPSTFQVPPLGTFFEPSHHNGSDSHMPGFGTLHPFRGVHGIDQTNHDQQLHASYHEDTKKIGFTRESDQVYGDGRHALHFPEISHREHLKQISLSPKPAFKSPQLKNMKPRADPEKPWVKINATTKGLNNRSAKIEKAKNNAKTNYDNITNPSYFRNGWSAQNDTPFFKYNKFSQLGSLNFTPESLRRFIYDHPVILNRDVLKVPYDPQAGRMILWIQKCPSDANGRYENEFCKKCRFKNCPVPNQTIKVGHMQVVFDERWTMYGDEADPYCYAGAVHLYCLERFLDLPMICRLPNVIVKVDDRKLNKEPNKKNGFMPPAAVQDAVQSFVDVCQNAKTWDDVVESLHRKDRFPGYPFEPEERTDYSAVYSKTLSYRCQDAWNRKEKRGIKAISTISKHMGDLVSFQAMEKATNANKRTKKEQIGERRSPRNHPGSPGLPILPVQEFENNEDKSESELRRSPRLAQSRALSIASELSESRIKELSSGHPYFPSLSFGLKYADTLKSNGKYNRKILRINTKLNCLSSRKHTPSSKISADTDEDNIVDRIKDDSYFPRESPCNKNLRSPLTPMYGSPRSILRSEFTKKRAASVSWAEDDDIAQTSSVIIRQNAEHKGCTNLNSSAPKIQKVPKQQKRRRH
jgi:hypothetical protein